MGRSAHQDISAAVCFFWGGAGVPCLGWFQRGDPLDSRIFFWLGPAIFTPVSMTRLKMIGYYPKRKGHDSMYIFACLLLSKGPPKENQGHWRFLQLRLANDCACACGIPCSCCIPKSKNVPNQTENKNNNQLQHVTARCWPFSPL